MQPRHAHGTLRRACMQHACGTRLKDHDRTRRVVTPSTRRTHTQRGIQQCCVAPACAAGAPMCIQRRQRCGGCMCMRMPWRGMRPRRCGCQHHEHMASSTPNPTTRNVVPQLSVLLVSWQQDTAGAAQPVLTLCLLGGSSQAHPTHCTQRTLRAPSRVCSCLLLNRGLRRRQRAHQKSSSVVNTNCSNVILRAAPSAPPPPLAITPAFWYSPTRRSKKLALPCVRCACGRAGERSGARACVRECV
jgi:hypothetical protein